LTTVNVPKVTLLCDSRLYCWAGTCRLQCRLGMGF